MSKRQKWQQAADRLTNLLEHTPIAKYLTPDEIDWAYLLRERFWEISNRMKVDPPSLADSDVVSIPDSSCLIVAAYLQAKGKPEQLKRW